MRSNLHWVRYLENKNAPHALTNNEDHILTSLGYGLAIRSCLPSTKTLLIAALPYIDFALNLPAWQKSYHASLEAVALHHKTRQIDLQRLTVGAIDIDLRLDEVDHSHLENLDSLANQINSRELKSQVLITQLRACLILKRLDLGELALVRLERIWDHLSPVLRFELLRIKCLISLAFGRTLEAQHLMAQVRILNTRDTPSLSAAKSHLLSGALYLIEGSGGMALSEISRGQGRLRNLPPVPEISARLEVLRSLAHNALGENLHRTNSQDRAIKLLSDVYRGDWIAKILTKTRARGTS